MKPEKLTYMANQIAGFFATQPMSEAEKAAKVAAHLDDFWEPRMRAQLHAHLAKGGAGLTPLARAAAAKMTLPAPQG